MGNTSNSTIHGSLSGIGTITGSFSTGGGSSQIDFEIIKEYIEQYASAYINERITLLDYVLDINVNNDGSVQTVRSEYETGIDYAFDLFIGNDGSVAIVK